jgi:hypothetical protein
LVSSWFGLKLVITILGTPLIGFEHFLLGTNAAFSFATPKYFLALSYTRQARNWALSIGFELYKGQEIPIYYPKVDNYSF